jgi:uncharacterized protein YpbB
MQLPYQHYIMKTLTTLVVGQKYALAEFDAHLDALRHYLKLVAALRERTNATRFETLISEAMMRI